MRLDDAHRLRGDVYKRQDEAMPLSFAPMPRDAFTGFQMIFLFSLSLLPEAESECRVLSLIHIFVGGSN